MRPVRSSFTASGVATSIPREYLIYLIVRILLGPVEYLLECLNRHRADEYGDRNDGDNNGPLNRAALLQ